MGRSTFCKIEQGLLLLRGFEIKTRLPLHDAYFELQIMRTAHVLGSYADAQQCKACHVKSCTAGVRRASSRGSLVTTASEKA